MVTTEKTEDIKIQGGYGAARLQRGKILTCVSVCMSCFVLQPALYGESVMPFGMPALWMAGEFGYVFYPASLCSFAALMLSQSAYKAGHAIAIIMCLLCRYAFENKNIKSAKAKAAASSACVCVCAVADALINGNTEIFLNGFFECLLAFPLTLVFLQAASCAGKLREARNLKKRDITCAVFFLSAFDGTLFAYGGLAAGLCMAVAVFGELMLSYYSDMVYSILFSSLTGYIIYVFSGNKTILPLLLFSAATCSFFEKNRTQMLAVFALSCAAIGFFTGISSGLYTAFGATAGACVFMALREKNVWGMVNVKSAVNSAGDAYTENVKKTADERLKRISSAMRCLAKAFEADNSGGKSDSKTKLIDLAAKEVCEKCQLCSYCWKTRAVDTGHSFYDMLLQYEVNGNIKISDGLAKYCVKQQKLASCLQKFCADIKKKEKTDKQIESSKNIISEQLISAADIFSSLKCEITSGEKEKQISEEISAKLAEKNCRATSVTAFTDACGRLNIRIAQGEKKLKNGEMLPLINAVCAKSMRKLNLTDSDTLIFIENDIFGYKYSYCACKRDNSEISGDSFIVNENEDGVLTAAVADGMGSGAAAKAESKKAVDVLKLFCEAGISAEAASGALNSILFGKNKSDMFTTLDICSLNMHTGRGRMVKYGGASAFIIRGRSTQEIKSLSLPAGVLLKAEPEVTGFQAQDGDIILLVTDGITDCIKDMAGVCEEIIKSGKRTTAEICTELIKRAKEYQNGACRDDCLAVGIRIFEKV